MEIGSQHTLLMPVAKAAVSVSFCIHSHLPAITSPVPSPPWAGAPGASVSGRKGIFLRPPDRCGSWLPPLFLLWKGTLKSCGDRHPGLTLQHPSEAAQASTMLDGGVWPRVPSQSTGHPSPRPSHHELFSREESRCPASCG